MYVFLAISYCVYMYLVYVCGCVYATDECDVVYIFFQDFETW